MLNYNDFEERLFNEAYAFCETMNRPATVEFTDVCKPNASYRALAIKWETPIGFAGPVINTENLYREYRQNGGDETAIQGIFQSTRECIGQAAEDVYQVSETYIDLVKDYEKAKDVLCCRVVTAERNAAILDNSPHLRIEDLALIYTIEAGPGSRVTVTNQMMEDWGVGHGQMHKDMMATIQDRNGSIIMPLANFLFDDQDLSEDGPGLLVVSTVRQESGAAALFYPGVMEQIRDELGGDFVVLPSSIHEVLCLPMDLAKSPTDLRQMVQDINRNVVAPQDFLSDNVYYCDGRDLTLVSKDRWPAREMDPELEEELDEPETEKEILVLKVETGKRPERIVIPNTLPSIQKAVDGHIQAIYPFDDPVALVCNEEGKLRGLPLNRGLYMDHDTEFYKKGDMWDAICGTFLVVGISGEKFASLSPELLDRYEARFEDPEMFLLNEKGKLEASPIKKNTEEKEISL